MAQIERRTSGSSSRRSAAFFARSRIGVARTRQAAAWFAFDSDGSRRKLRTLPFIALSSFVFSTGPSGRMFPVFSDHTSFLEGYLTYDPNEHPSGLLDGAGPGRAGGGSGFGETLGGSRGKLGR